MWFQQLFPCQPASWWSTLWGLWGSWGLGFCAMAAAAAVAGTGVYPQLYIVVPTVTWPSDCDTVMTGTGTRVMTWPSDCDIRTRSHA